MKCFKHFTLLKIVVYQLLLIEELIFTKMKRFLKRIVAQIYLPDNLRRMDINIAHKKRDFLKSAYIKISMKLHHASSKDKQMPYDLHN